jgi:S1-C subfamily serine protease
MKTQTRIIQAVVMVLAICLVAGFCCIPANSEIYKYQDENGNWHFTDTPPEDKADSAEPMAEAARSSAGLEDLRKSLFEKYSPKTPVERAAIATLTIESNIGKGSGFFISPAGHILTNRHVIRGDTEQFQKADKALDTIDERLEKIDDQFSAEKTRLEKFKRHLDEYRRAVADMPEGAAKQREQRRYEIERDRYEAQKQDFENKQSEYENRKSVYEDKKYEFRSTTSTAALTRNFKIILKDGRELYAYLVRISSDHDLALLKIDGHQTPFIHPAELGRLSQGDPLYAIGSPVGLRDSVSNGIFSGYEKNFIKTDAKIYPGNSGGPLINQDGRVVGINSFKRLTRHFEGLGFAIPIKVATSEFGAYLD